MSEYSYRCQSCGKFHEFAIHASDYKAGPLTLLCRDCFTDILLMLVDIKKERKDAKDEKHFRRSKSSSPYDLNMIGKDREMRKLRKS